MQPNGKPGINAAGVAGSDGVSYVPTSASTIEFGAYDSRDQKRKDDDLIILAHELFGHAFYEMQGTEDRRPLNKADRAGNNAHDKAINRENQIRLILKLDVGGVQRELRGTFKNNRPPEGHQGESLWRRIGTQEWQETGYPTDEDIGPPR